MLTRISLNTPRLDSPDLGAPTGAAAASDALAAPEGVVVDEASAVQDREFAEHTAARAADAVNASAAAHADPETETPQAVDNAERVAARQFWLPNDTWRCITNFLDRDEVLNLRATSTVLNAQADSAITTLMLWKRDVAAFINAPRFKFLRTLELRNADDEVLHDLADHFEDHSRPGLTLRLSSRLRISAEGIARLIPLPLAGLSIAPSYGNDRSILDIDVLDTLATCPFPVELKGNLSAEGFAAAARIATLSRLETSSPIDDDALARRFSAHPALHTLAVGIGANLSSRAIDAFATIPELHTLRLTAWNDSVFDAAAAHTLAAHRSLECFEISGHPSFGLPEDCFAALARSRTLTTLTVPLRPAMLALANMASVRNLAFHTIYSPEVPFRMDLATARSIAAMPSLASLTFGCSHFEAGAMMVILDGSSADTLVFQNHYPFHGKTLGALLANTRLRALAFRGGNLSDDVVRAICHHPTLERLRIMDLEYSRVPGQEALTQRN